MALPVPKAFWPLVITAGANDKIDVKRTSDSALFAATIAAGTYYTAASLARAVRDALHAVWVNGWGVEAIGSNMADFNPSFEADAAGWAQYNNTSGLEPFTSWGRAVLWSNDRKAEPLLRGLAALRYVWAVNNTSTKGLLTNRTQALADGTRAGVGWRLNEWFRVRFKARAFGTNQGQMMSPAWNTNPTTTTTISNPGLTSNFQQYEFRVQWTTALPVDGVGGATTGELYVTIALASGTNGTIDVDDLEVYSELLAANPTGHIAIGGNAAFSLLFASGANAATSARDVLGWGTTDTGSALTAVSTYQHQNGWYADRPVVDDTGDLPNYERAQALALGGQTYGLDFGTRYNRLVSLMGLNSYKTWKADEGISNVNEALERLLDNGWQRLRWWKDASVEGTYEDLMLDAGRMKIPPRQRLSPGKAMYSLALPFLKFVP